MKRLNVSRNMLYTWGGCGGGEGVEVGRVWRWGGSGGGREWESANIGLNVRVERSREEVYVWEEGGEEGGCMCGRREGKCSQLPLHEVL